MSAVSRARGWLPGGKGAALLVLAVVNLALILVICGGLTTLSDVPAPFTGHLIGAGVTATLALLVRRRMVLILALGALAILAAHATLGLAACCGIPRTGAPMVTAAAQPIAQPYGPLSVVTLNTWHRNRDLARLQGYLASGPADVVVLSEFGGNKRPLLAALKRAYPYQVDCARACNMALLSRLPFEASGSADIAGGKPPFVWAKVGGGVTVVGTHFYRPSRNPWRHARQVEAFAMFLRRIDGPVVLAGDLNTSPWSYAYRRLRITSGLVPADKLLPSWPAWPVPLPQIALDHILVSADLTTTAVGTGPAVGSDHLPVWAQLQRAPYFERVRSATRRLASVSE